MSPSIAHIRSLVNEYLDRHPGERESLVSLLAALDVNAAPTSRSTLPGHVTCSAVVIDRLARVLHVTHRATGLHLAPGGHVEASDDTLLATALREVEEEVGIPASRLVLTPEFRAGPIDIGIHDIDANPSKGEGAHQHYDFRFVVLVDHAPDLALQASEVAGAAWLPFDQVTAPTLRAKLSASGLDGVVRPVNASAVIHDGHGQYLLHLRDANKPEICEQGCWSLLGGGREPQDSNLLDTIRRELLEEAGLRIADLSPYSIGQAIGIAGTRVPMQLFEGRWNGDPSALPLTEGVMLAWFRPEKLPFLTMLSSTRELLERHATEHPPPVDDHRARRNSRATAPANTAPHIIGVHLYLERDGHVLLGLRHPNSPYAGGTWHALAGHLQAESATAGLVREAYEEAGLVIDPADLELVHTVHMVDRPGEQPRIGLFFQTHVWEGVPAVREPDKCVGWQWWNTKDLPEPIVPYTRMAIEGIQACRSYTEMGWPGAVTA